MKLNRTIYAILFLLHQMTINASNNCSWSTRNLEMVSHCPLTLKEREYEAINKNCKALSLMQTCSEPLKFTYHCVASEKENVFMEVCAPEVEIQYGYCATFNPQTGQLESHAVKQCANTSRPCPERYVSSDSYLYPFCYGIDITTIKEMTNISSTRWPEDRFLSRTDFWLVWAGSFILSIISIIFSIILVLIKRKKGMEQTDPQAQRPETELHEHPQAQQYV